MQSPDAAHKLSQIEQIEQRQRSRKMSRDKVTCVLSILWPCLPNNVVSHTVDEVKAHGDTQDLNDGSSSRTRFQSAFLL